MKRKCTICEIEKDVKEFIYKNGDRIHESQKRCNDCKNAIDRFNKSKYRFKQKADYLVGNIKDGYIKEMFKFFTNENGQLECPYNGTILTKDTYTLEHIQPLDKGGCHAIFNIIPCSASTNLSKGNSMMEEWFQQQEYFDRSRLHKIYGCINYCSEELLEDPFADILNNEYIK